MLKVNMTSQAFQRMVDHVSRRYEQIGLLIGQLGQDGLWVTDVVPGESGKSERHASLSPEVMARIAHDILTGALQGRIVGWYHSHIGQGIFMSDVDVDTQMVLQQFSPYVIALVIDSLTYQYGIFMYDHKKGLIQIPEDYIEVV